MTANLKNRTALSITCIFRLARKLFFIFLSFFTIFLDNVRTIVDIILRMNGKTQKGEKMRQFEEMTKRQLESLIITNMHYITSAEWKEMGFQEYEKIGFDLKKLESKIEKKEMVEILEKISSERELQWA